MKNIEKYMGEIAANGWDECDVAKQYVKVACFDTSCSTCFQEVLKWLNSEYTPQIDWNKVPVDTPVYLHAFGNAGVPRYFCKYENGKVFLFDSGRTSWSGEDRFTEWKTEHVQLARPEDIKKYCI
jgi:hypothetical protein